MKKALKFLILVLIIGLFFSCEKDEENSDDNNLTENFLKYGAEQVLINATITIDCLGTDEDGPMFKSIGLYSSGINVNEETGIGSAIFFNLYNNECVVDGTYTYSYSTQYGDSKFDADFIWEGDIVEDEAWADWTYSESTSGNLTLTKNGNNYEIEFSMLSPENKELSGYFEGVLE